MSQPQILPPPPVPNGVVAVPAFQQAQPSQVQTGVPDGTVGAGVQPQDPELAHALQAWHSETWLNDLQRETYFRNSRHRLTAECMVWAGTPIAYHDLLAFLETGRTQGSHPLGWYIETRGMERLIALIPRICNPPQQPTPEMLCRLHAEMLTEPPVRSINGEDQVFPVGRFTEAYNDASGILMARVGAWLEPMQAWMRDPTHPLTVDVPARLAQILRTGCQAQVYDVGQRRLSWFCTAWFCVALGFPIPFVLHDPQTLNSAIEDGQPGMLAQIYRQSLMQALHDGITAKRTEVL